MDDLDWKIEVPEVIVKTKKAKNGHSKIFSCILSCLENGCHLHMLQYTDATKTEFEVKLINKKKRDWLRQDISLFEELDGLSSKYSVNVEGAKYPEAAKGRYKANMSKLKKSKYVEETKGYPKKLSKSITVMRYKILKFPHEVEMKEKKHSKRIQVKKCSYKKKRVSISEGIPVENKSSYIPTTLSHYSCLSGEPLKAYLEGSVTYGNVSPENICKSMSGINQITDLEGSVMCGNVSPENICKSMSGINQITDLEGSVTYGNVSPENICKSMSGINQITDLEGSAMYGNVSPENICKSMSGINQILSPGRNMTYMDLENCNMTEKVKDFPNEEDNELLLTFENETYITEFWNRGAQNFHNGEDDLVTLRNETTTESWSINQGSLDQSPQDGSMFADIDQYDDAKTSDPLLSSTVELDKDLGMTGYDWSNYMCEDIFMKI